VGRRPVGIWRPELPGAYIPLVTIRPYGRYQDRPTRGPEQEGERLAECASGRRCRDRDSDNNIPDPAVADLHRRSDIGVARPAISSERHPRRNGDMSSPV
jgi:hypothetical protein